MITLLGTEYKSIAYAARQPNLIAMTRQNRITRHSADWPHLFDPADSRFNSSGAHKITYQGKEYPSLTAFARAFGVDARLVSNRYGRGVHNPADLIKPKQVPNAKKITIGGKTYSSIHEMANDLASDDLSSEAIYARYYQGVRDLDKLTKPIDDGHRKMIKRKKSIKIIYHGKTYRSLAALARACNLPPKVVQHRYRKSHNIDYVTAPVRNSADVVRNIRHQVTAYNQKLVHQRDLLMVADVAKLTGYGYGVLSSALSSFYRQKKSHTNLGFDQSDIERIVPTKEEIANAPVPNQIIKWAFKKSVVDKIKQKMQHLAKSNLVMIPQLDGNYFYNPQDKSLWSNRRSGNTNGIFTKIVATLPNHYGIYLTTSKGSTSTTLSINTIEDLIANPTLTASDLTTREQLMTTYGVSQNQWNYIFAGRPFKLHLRYDQNRQIVRGYSPKQTTKIINIIKQYLETHK